LQSEIDRLLAATAVPPAQRREAKQAILRQWLNAATLANGWRLVPSPGSSFWQQIRRAGVAGRLLAFLAAHTVQYALFLLSWWLIGRAVLQGDLGREWLLAWAVLLLALVPLRLLVNGLQASVAIRAGRLLQKRLLYGALTLHPDEIRHLGAGQLMGRVFESEAVESLVLSGGLLGLTAIIELALAGWILSQGAAGFLHVLGLLAWLALMLVLAGSFYRRRQQWTAARRHLTHDLIEKMVGHRTCAVQVAPGQRHAGEEEMLAGYMAVAARMDKAMTYLVGLAAPGWLLVGLAGLAPVFLAGPIEVTAVAISLGGILSAELALRKIGQSAVHLAGAAIAWEQIAHLFHAAARPPLTATPVAALAASPATGNRPLLAIRDLSFSYRDRGLPILRGCHLRLYEGDRVLLEGPSGGGKSTLAAVLAGLRRPQSGLLQLYGLDQPALPAASWRRHVVCTPQFHENHVLGGTFIFNLLLGRPWPPRPQDLAAAEAICIELGLGEVLGRMPARMLQTVGEIGWQLSHGERSRLYLARSLLQGADVMVLDESFAALDPKTMKLALQCVLRHTRTLVVLAHP
jgi:ATP-binding cassette subfamily B protein